MISSILSQCNCGYFTRLSTAFLRAGNPCKHRSFDNELFVKSQLIDLLLNKILILTFLFLTKSLFLNSFSSFKQLFDAFHQFDPSLYNSATRVEVKGFS